MIERFISILKDVVVDVRQFFAVSIWAKGDVLIALLKNGIYIEDNFISKANADLVRREINLKISEPHTKLWCDDLGSDTRIYGLEKLTDSIEKTFDVKAMAELGSKYLGQKIQSYFVLGAKLLPVDGGLGSGGGWHRDSEFSHQFKAIIYLSDVSEDCGPFQYINRSHTSISKWADTKKIGGGTRFKDSLVTDICQGRLNEVVADAGSAVYVDTRGVHRGKPINSGSRYAITFYFWTTPPPKHILDLLQGEGDLSAIPVSSRTS